MWLPGYTEDTLNTAMAPEGDLSPISCCSGYRRKLTTTNIPICGNWGSLRTHRALPRRPSYGVYLSQLIRFARASLHVTYFNYRNKFLTAKLLKKGYRYHKPRKAFSKFDCRHYHVSLKNLCNKVFVIQNSMEIWYINLRKLLRIFSNVLQTMSRERGIL